MLRYYPHIKKYRSSHSSRRRYKQCERLIEFNKFMRGQSRSEGYAAEVGKALHEGLQTYWITHSEDEAFFAMMKKYPYHLEQEFDMRGDRSLEACFATLQNMIGANALRNREIATITCLDGVVRPAVEVPFEIDFPDIDIGGIPVSYIGYMDAILFNRAVSEYEVSDIKTTRDDKVNPAIKYRFDTQCLPYGFVLQRMLNLPLEEGYKVNYLHCYVDLLQPTTMLYPMQKSYADVQDWLWMFWKEINDIKMYAESARWPRNEEACVVYRTSKCRFYDYCGSRDPLAIQIMILNGETPAEEEPFEPWVKFDLRIAA